MTTLRTPLCDVLGIEYPIIQAPMAGASTVDLVAAVSEAGALGGFGHAYTEPEVMRQDAQKVRARTQRPFAINLFAAPTPDEPPVEQQRGAIEAMRSHLEQSRATGPRPRSAAVRAGPGPADRGDLRHQAGGVHWSSGDATPDAVSASAAARRPDRRVGN